MNRVDMMEALAADAAGSRPYRALRKPRPEDDGMYGVQTWSAGPIYPAIISVVEQYMSYEEYLGYFGLRSGLTKEKFYAWDLADRLLDTTYVLAIPGQELIEFDSRGAAESYALRMQGVV